MLQIPVNSANRYAHIDAMRALAVMLVVVAHAGLGFIIPGGSGVTIFFAISGFIITHLILREFESSGSFNIRGFYFRRIRKIAPPFLIIILLPSLVMGLVSPMDWKAVSSQLLFVYNWVKLAGHGPVLPGSEVVWSLAIEEQFYILFALIWLLLICGRKAVAYLTVLAGVGILTPTILRFYLALDPSNSSRIYYGTDTRLDGICLGVLSALAYYYWRIHGSKADRFSRIFSSDLILIVAVILYLGSLVYRDDYFRDTLRYSLQAIAACTVILYGLLPGESPLRTAFYRVSTLRVISTIGLASYSIYLVHSIVTLYLQPYLEALPLLPSVLLLSTLGTILGILIYRYVETPVLEYSKRRSAGGPSSGK